MSSPCCCCAAPAAVVLTLTLTLSVKSITLPPYHNLAGSSCSLRPPSVAFSLFSSPRAGHSSNKAMAATIIAHQQRRPAAKPTNTSRPPQPLPVEPLACRNNTTSTDQSPAQPRACGCPRRWQLCILCIWHQCFARARRCQSGAHACSCPPNGCATIVCLPHRHGFCN
jgi:hypothetical protein